MANEYYPVVDQEPDFLIRRLQCSQMFAAEISIQIPGLNTTEFRQVINHLLLSAYVIVYEGSAFQRTLAICDMKNIEF